MALRALQRNVCASQRETRGRVIESGIRPGRSAVAGFAGLRHPRLYVVRIGRA